MNRENQIEMIKKYGNKNSCYIPFEGFCYPLHSVEFVSKGFMKIAPSLRNRDYKDPLCVIVKNQT